jgi:hypothetical protein
MQARWTHRRTDAHCTRACTNERKSPLRHRCRGGRVRRRGMGGTCYLTTRRVPNDPAHGPETSATRERVRRRPPCRYSYPAAQCPSRARESLPQARWCRQRVCSASAAATILDCSAGHRRSRGRAGADHRPVLDRQRLSKLGPSGSVRRFGGGRLHSRCEHPPNATRRAQHCRDAQRAHQPCVLVLLCRNRHEKLGEAKAQLKCPARGGRRALRTPNNMALVRHGFGEAFVARSSRWR